jgi:hypothetical protein
MRANQDQRLDSVQSPNGVPGQDPTELAAGACAVESLTKTEKFILETLERLDAADTETENLRRALANSRDIGAAVGVLMAFRKISQAEAIEVLRRSSQDQNRKLHVVAREVIATGELPPCGP